MDVRLKVLGGSHEGEEIQILGDMFVIGRGEECHLRPQSDLISRRHCAVVIDETTVSLRDFGSKNGTFVNEARVDGQRALKSGDRLRVGQLEFEVLLVRAADGAKRKQASEPVDPNSLFDGEPKGLVETSRPPAADTLQFAPPTIAESSPTSDDESSPESDDEKKPQGRLRRFFGGE